MSTPGAAASFPSPPSAGSAAAAPQRRLGGQHHARLLKLLVSIWVGFITIQYISIVPLLADHHTKTKENNVRKLPTITRSCTCVNCDQDPLCGGLWRGLSNLTTEATITQTKLRVVISHCEKPLYWTSAYLADFEQFIASIHVINKCASKIKGAPRISVRVLLPDNVGRNDHSFAYYITTLLPGLVSPADNEDSVVLFLKDGMVDDIHQGRSTEFQKVDLKLLINTALTNGFGCALIPYDGSVSVYHNKTILSDFGMSNYTKGHQDYSIQDGVQFQSSYKNLGDFYTSLKAKPTPEEEPSLVPVCYGGIFAASVKSIYRQDMKVWKALQMALERGNNIQEGHYAERSWARLLTTPLMPFQVDALQKYSHGVLMRADSMYGSLAKEVQTQENSEGDSKMETAFMDVNKLKDSVPKRRFGRFVSLEKQDAEQNNIRN